MKILPTAHLNGLSGQNGVFARLTLLETVYGQGRELLDVVKRELMFPIVNLNSVKVVRS